ncbi:MAG: hypothetical protein M0Z87_09025 [Actinomycetota bacterium]|nr:hypothetical protein [Actinomycetota bacterium]
MGATSPVADAAQLTAGHWSALPAAPIAPRQGASVVWTGTDMIVWGGASGAHGNHLHADGAAYDPTTRTWHLLPPAPLSPRSSQAGVWTGHELVIWGGYTHIGGSAFTVTSSGAAYDPTTNRWRTLPPAPLSPRANALAVWTGTSVLLLGGHPALVTAGNRGFGDGALYDPSTGRWTHLAGPRKTGGLRLSWVAAVQARGEMLAWSTWWTTHRVNATTASVSAGTQLYRYRGATRRWRLLPTSPASLPAVQNVIWTGHRAVVRGATFTCGPCAGPPVPEATAIFDPSSGAWTRLPPDPLGGGHQSSAWTGAALFSFDPNAMYGPVNPGAGSAYEPRTNIWQRIPSAPTGCAGSADPLWTGQQILMYCPGSSPGSSATGGLAFTPAR